jgi:hypothetical protein
MNLSGFVWAGQALNQILLGFVIVWLMDEHSTFVVQLKPQTAGQASILMTDPTFITPDDQLRRMGFFCRVNDQIDSLYKIVKVRLICRGIQPGLVEWKIAS